MHRWNVCFLFLKIIYSSSLTYKRGYIPINPLFVVVQLLSRIWRFGIPWTACSTPGSPVLHYLLEFVQIHVHWVGDAIQPSHSLQSPSPPALNLSQHQGVFQWVGSSHQVARVLEKPIISWYYCKSEIHLTPQPTKHHRLAQPTFNVVRKLTFVYSWAKSLNTKPIL